MSEIYTPPEGVLIRDIKGTPLLCLWPTILCFRGAVRRICLIGANEDLRPPHSTYNTRKIEASTSGGLYTLVIEAVRINRPFIFAETSHPDGPILLQRGEESDRVRPDPESSAFLRYLTLQVLSNTGKL